MRKHQSGLIVDHSNNITEFIDILCVPEVSKGSSSPILSMGSSQYDAKWWLDKRPEIITNNDKDLSFDFSGTTNEQYDNGFAIRPKNSTATSLDLSNMSFFTRVKLLGRDPDDGRNVFFDARSPLNGTSLVFSAESSIVNDGLLVYQPSNGILFTSEPNVLQLGVYANVGITITDNYLRFFVNGELVGEKDLISIEQPDVSWLPFFTKEPSPSSVDPANSAATFIAATFGRSIPDELAVEFTKNPYQIFKQQKTIANNAVYSALMPSAGVVDADATGSISAITASATTGIALGGITATANGQVSSVSITALSGDALAVITASASGTLSNATITALHGSAYTGDVIDFSKAGILWQNTDYYMQLNRE